MLIYRHVVREVATLIAGAVGRSIESLQEGSIEQEPQVTDRMLGRIEECLHGYVAKGVRWSAKTLTDRGRGAQESEFGADFMGVLTVDLPELKVSKGFLAQAKLVRGGCTSGDRRTLTKQCEKMLAVTPDAFVFLYFPDAVRVVPAISVLGSSEDPVELYSRASRTFFEDHLECFIGDRAIGAATPATLDALRKRLNARTGLFLKARQEPPSA